MHKNMSFAFMLVITKELELNMLNGLNKSGVLELMNQKFHEPWKQVMHDWLARLLIQKQKDISLLLFQSLILLLESLF
jgi:hypothetical protein